MNITDVGHLVGDADDGEDKMAVAAKREHKKSHEIAEFYTNKFFEDWDKLNLLRPNIVCKATDHIAEMIALIERLEQRGFAYQSGGNVYFDVAKFEKYGDLAKLDLEKLRAGARIEIDSEKRGPFDFALWFTKSKFKDQELQWDSPWGRGYPGWHIECSAMSMKYLGEAFDIHCGGVDHISVHHTNEIAQSEGATGKPWVKHWFHTTFLNLGDQKMAKSAGTFIVLDTLIERGISPMAYRFFCLSAQYRSHLSFSWEALEGAEQSLKRLRSSVIALRSEAAGPANMESSSNYLADFRAAIFEDLNTPRALAVVWKLLSDTTITPATRLLALEQCDEVLGLNVKSFQAESSIPVEIQTLIDQRAAARAAKNFAESDRLRDEIISRGYLIEDTPKGIIVKRSSGLSVLFFV